MNDVFLFPVYLFFETNSVSFVGGPGSVCIGETVGSLEEFLNWMKGDWVERGIDVSNFPTIKER